MTPSTFWGKQFVIVVLAVGLPVLLVKVIRIQRYSTSCALEALWVPVLAHRINVVTLFN